MATRNQSQRRLVIGLSTLLLLLTGLIALVLIQEQRQHSEPLLASRESIQRLVIERQGQSALVLERIGERWALTEPCALPVTTRRIEPLLSALSNVEGSYHRSEVDLPETGLVEPSVVITMGDDAISLGTADSTGERRYAMLGERIGFVPEWVVSLANGGITALARPDVFVASLSRLGDVPADALPRWQALSARQIVQWPVPDAPQILSEEVMEVEFADGRQDSLTLTRNARFTALRLGKGQCAHILSNDEIPG